MLDRFINKNRAEKLRNKKLAMSYSLAQLTNANREYENLGFWSKVWQWLFDHSEFMQKRAAYQLTIALQTIQHEARNNKVSTDKKVTDSIRWHKKLDKYYKYGKKQLKIVANNNQKTQSEAKTTSLNQALTKVWQFRDKLKAPDATVSNEQKAEFNQAIDELMQVAVVLDTEVPDFKLN